MKVFRSTGFFAIIVILFASYVYYFEYVKKNESDKAAEEAKRIFPLGKEDVEKVVLRNKDKNIVLKKSSENGQWQIIQPINDLADQGEALSLVESLLFEKGEVVVSGDEVNYKEFSLDETEKNLSGISVFSKGRDKSARIEKQISFAEIKSFDGSRYIRIDREFNGQTKEKKVLLVKSSLHSLVAKKVNELRDKRIFRQSFGNIKKVKFLSKDDSWVLSESKNESKDKTDDAWKIEGSKTPLDKEQVRSYLFSIGSLKAEKIVSETSSKKELKEKGLLTPDSSIQLILEKEPHEKILISKEIDNRLFLKRSSRSEIFEINKRTRDSLVKKTDDFKDKKFPFAIDKNSVSAISLYDKNKNKKVKIDVDKNEKVNSLIDQLQNLSVFKFLGGNKVLKKQSGVEEVKNQILFFDKDGGKIFELSIGNTVENKEAKNEKLRYVSTSQSLELLSVLEESIELLEIDQVLKKKEEKKEVEHNEK